MNSSKIKINVSDDHLYKDADQQPFLQTYLLDESAELKNSHHRKAVIVCPGGAYRFKSDREAEPVAVRFLAEGFQAFVLQYSISPAIFPCALIELAMAVTMVRKHAKEWNIDETEIYLCGFSAGGHLCGCLGTMWNSAFLRDELKKSIKYDSDMWKPNGMILCYPVISMGNFTHEESRDLLMGDIKSDKMMELLSLENRVSADTVPTFLWHTTLDEAVPVENSMLFATQLQKYHIPFEMHLYEEGNHGLSLCNHVTEDLASQVISDNENWIQMAINWINRR